MGKLTINGSFSIAMLNYQRVLQDLFGTSHGVHGVHIYPLNSTCPLPFKSNPIQFQYLRGFQSPSRLIWYWPLNSGAGVI